MMITLTMTWTMTRRMNMPRLLLRGRARRRASADDGDEARGLQAGPAQEHAVDIRLLGERGRVVRLDAAAIEDADGLSQVLRAKVGEDPPQISVNLGSLARRGVVASSDRPHRLVGQTAPAGLLGRQARQPRPELTLDDRERESLAALLRRLADAQHRRESVAQRRAEPLVDLVVGLVEDVPPFRVAEQDE